MVAGPQPYSPSHSNLSLSWRKQRQPRLDGRSGGTEVTRAKGGLRHRSGPLIDGVCGPKPWTEACARDVAGNQSQVPLLRGLCVVRNHLWKQRAEWHIPCVSAWLSRKPFYCEFCPSHASELRLLLKVSSKNCYIKIEPVDKGSFAEVIEVLGRSVLEDSWLLGKETVTEE